MIYLFIIAGLIGLWLGTKWILKAALGFAKIFNLSHAFVGLALLSVGTDLPEIFVTVKAAILQLGGTESSGIITGNVIGSTVCQITAIIGISALFLRFNLVKKSVYTHGFFLLGSIALLFLFSLNGTVSRFEAAILLLAYITYYIILINGSTDKENDNENVKTSSKPILIGYFIIGLITLIISSNLVVDNAMLIALQWGVEQSFVGIIIIGLGTSLPELAVSIGAAFKKAAGLSIGNIIGSNIFDTLVPMGIGGLISPIAFNHKLVVFDLLILFATSILVLLFLKSKKGISKTEGTILIGIYATYIGLKIIFGVGN